MDHSPRGKLNIIAHSLAILFLSLLVSHSVAQADWRQEWEKTVKAAQKEGQVVIHGARDIGMLFGQAFQRAYPDIKVITVTAGRGTVRVQRILTERRAKQYLVDLYIGSPRDVYSTFLPAKMIEPVRPLLVLPEVLDQTKWWKGQHYYVDPQSKYIFIYEGAPQGGGIAYNKKLVNPKELKSFWDLLNPKWKGKIISVDPMISGASEQNLRFFNYHPKIGPEFIKSLYGEMNVTLSRNDRQILDWLAVGKFAFAYFTRGAKDAIKQGLPIGEIPPGHFKEGAFVDPYTGLVSFMNRAPHPNAAKVVVNWLLSRKGQIAFQKNKVDAGCDSCESLREDIPKDNIARAYRRKKEINYMMTTRPEYIDMKPIRQLIKKSLPKGRRK